MTLVHIQPKLFDFPEDKTGRGTLDWNFTLSELKKPGPLYWRVSAAWASKEIDCTLHGIAREGGCGGKCCKGSYFWPAKLSGTGVCLNLGAQGCVLGDEKPVTCLLYPFYVRRNNLEIYGRALIGTCKNCYRQGGKSIAENNHQNFSLLFGPIVADQIIFNTRYGKNTNILVPENVRQDLAREMEQEDSNAMPILRVAAPSSIRSSGR